MSISNKSTRSCSRLRGRNGCRSVTLCVGASCANRLTVCRRWSRSSLPCMNSTRSCSPSSNTTSTRAIPTSRSRSLNARAAISTVAGSGPRSTQSETRHGGLMKLALDPYMLRTVPLGDLPALVAELGYRYLELSPREDFLPFFVHPRADRASIAALRTAASSAGVEIASILPLYRWSSPNEDERQAAVRYWKRAIEVAVELGCSVMNSELSGRPEDPHRSESQLWRSLEELLPIFEREGIQLRLEPHPDDFIEDGRAAIDFIRAIDS